VVGVNVLTGDVGDELEILRVSHEVELEQRDLVTAAGQRAIKWRSTPRSRAWSRRQERREHRAVDARCGARGTTLGEICNAFRPLWASTASR